MYRCLKFLVSGLFITSILVCLLTPVWVQADDCKNFYDDALEYMENRDYQNAIRLFNESIRLKPNNPYAFHNRAHASEAIGEFDQAIEDFNKAIALDPNDAKHHYCKAKLYYNLARYEDAIEEFEAAIGLNQTDPWTYHMLGHSYERICDYERALFCLQRAIDLDPEEKIHSSCYDRVSQIKENIAKGIPNELQEIPEHQESDNNIHEGNIFVEGNKRGLIEEKIVSLEQNLIVRSVTIIAAIFTIIMFFIMLLKKMWM